MQESRSNSKSPSSFHLHGDFFFQVCDCQTPNGKNDLNLGEEKFNASAISSLFLANGLIIAHDRPSLKLPRYEYTNTATTHLKFGCLDPFQSPEICA